MVHHLVADFGNSEKQQVTQQLERMLQSCDFQNSTEDEIVRYIEENKHLLDEMPTDLLKQLQRKLESKRAQLDGDSTQRASPTLV